MQAIELSVSTAHTTGTAKISGYIEPGYDALLNAFIKNFQVHGDVGAACAVYRHGKPVADLWGGFADAATQKPWQENTIVLAFSAAKGPTAVCMNQLAEAGLLDIDLPIAHYWPEFGCNGKEQITTRQVLCHRAGLAAVEGNLTLEEVLAWDPVVAAIAAQAPNWEPGTAHGYHARSYGWILGEVLKRITGKSIGAYIARNISAPLGLSYWVGLPEHQLSRCATLLPPEGGSDAIAELLGADSLTARVMSGPSGLFGYNEMWNRPELLMAEMPSSNGIGDARSFARLYAAVMGEVDGVRLLGDDQLARACEPQAKGPDKVIFRDSCYGLGFMLQPLVAPEAGANSFGHQGAGGAVAFADPDADISFAYVMNAMKFDLSGDPRSAELIKATYDCIT